LEMASSCREPALSQFYRHTVVPYNQPWTWQRGSSRNVLFNANSAVLREVSK